MVLVSGTHARATTKPLLISVPSFVHQQQVNLSVPARASLNNCVSCLLVGCCQSINRPLSGDCERWDNASIAQAVALAEQADQVIVVISNAEDEGGEGQDRKSIALASDQNAMAHAVFAALKSMPAVRSTLMMINGGVIGIDSLKEAAPSILEIFMPGVYGPLAVAETVWGQNVPGGSE